MKIEDVLLKKSELESKILTIDNHIARTEASGFSTMSVDGYYPVSISASEADIILSQKRAAYQVELDKINQAIDAVESLAKSMLTDEEFIPY